jgi:pseudoazurin
VEEKMKLVGLVICWSFFIQAFVQVQAKVWEVKMLNKGTQKIKGRYEKMVFEPNLLFIQKGDSVKFIPVQKGHNVQSLRGKGALPKGASTWKSKMNKEHIQLFSVAGVHGIECKPHYAMGMVGAIVVDKNIKNLDAFSKNKKVRGKSKKRLAQIVERIRKGLN